MRNLAKNIGYLRRVAKGCEAKLEPLARPVRPRRSGRSDRQFPFFARYKFNFAATVDAPITSLFPLARQCTAPLGSGVRLWRGVHRQSPPGGLPDSGRGSQRSGDPRKRFCRLPHPGGMPDACKPAWGRSEAVNHDPGGRYARPPATLWQASGLLPDPPPLSRIHAVERTVNHRWTQMDTDTERHFRNKTTPLLSEAFRVHQEAFSLVFNLCSSVFICGSTE